MTGRVRKLRPFWSSVVRSTYPEHLVQRIEDLEAELDKERARAAINGATAFRLGAMYQRLEERNAVLADRVVELELRYRELAKEAAPYGVIPC